VKLGLVEVSAVSASDVKRLIAGAQNRLREIHEEYSKLGLPDNAEHLDGYRLPEADFKRFLTLYVERKQLTGLGLADLPAPRARTKSDADGHFRLVLPCGDYFLVAQAERQVWAKTEKFYWFVPATAIEHADKHIMLTNDNQLGNDSLNPLELH
jgi:hypothetical protein